MATAGAEALVNAVDGLAVEGCGGVSVYLPAPPDPVSPYYGRLALSESHDWEDMLDAYAAAVRGRA